MKRSVELDILKGLAIISVVLYHIGLLSPGFLGVDIFLVINGYLVTKGLLSRLDAQSFNYWQWMCKRLARLWPLIVAAVFVSLCIGYFLMLPDDLENLGESAVASSFGAQNILSAITTRNYWDAGNDFKPLMHLWYVGILFQCYIVYPLILIISYKLGKDKHKVSMAVIAVLSLISLTMCLLPIVGPFDKFYYLPFRFYEIGVGGLIAFASLRQTSKDKSSAHNKNWAILIAYLAVLFLLIYPLDGFSNVVKSMLVCFLTGVCVLYSTILGGAKIFQRQKIWHVFVILGMASYSIYIWHQVIFAYYRYVVQPNPQTVDYIIKLSIAAVVSFLSYRYIEKPLSGLKNSKSVLYPVAAMVAIASLFGGYLYIKAGVVRDVPELDIYTNSIHRGMHAEYCDRVYSLDRPFENNGKKRVLVVGNSYARDFCNVIIEAGLQDSIDLTYMYFVDKIQDPNPQQIQRAEEADIIFIRGTKRFDGIAPEKQFGISTKNYGGSNGYNYNRRFRSDYYNLRVEMVPGVKEEYLEEKNFWGEGRMVDFIAPVVDDNWKMPVFTDTHKYISQDCGHLTKNGAAYYAKIFNLCEILGIN